jgi:hypothetical protein
MHMPTYAPVLPPCWPHMPERPISHGTLRGDERSILHHSVMLTDVVAGYCAGGCQQPRLQLAVG